MPPRPGHLLRLVRVPHDLRHEPQHVLRGASAIRQSHPPRRTNLTTNTNTINTTQRVDDQRQTQELRQAGRARQDRHAEPRQLLRATR